MEKPDPEEKVIRAMEKSADLYGYRKSYARMFGVLYFSEGEMTLDELSEKTGYARSTVSQGMNKLSNFYMVEKKKKDGEGKKLFYTANEDLEKMFMKLLENEVSREIEIMQDALEEAETEMAENGDQQGLEKVRNLQKTYSKSERFINLLKKLPSGNFVDRIYSILGKQKDE